MFLGGNVAAFEEHCRDCERILGDRCEEVNRWMDDGFDKYKAHHRFLKHHRRGVVIAGKKFGELGRQAALVHVLRDCGKIPLPNDYDYSKLADGPLILPAEALMGVWSNDYEFDTAARRLLENDRGR